MSTTSVIGYRNSQGELRGTYVHFDGFPCKTIPQLRWKLRMNGIEGLVEWIEVGVKGGGYKSLYTTVPFNDVLMELNEALEENDYGYFLSDEGDLLVVHLSSPVAHCDICADLIAHHRCY